MGTSEANIFEINHWAIVWRNSAALSQWLPIEISLEIFTISKEFSWSNSYFLWSTTDYLLWSICRSFNTIDICSWLRKSLNGVPHINLISSFFNRSSLWIKPSERFDSCRLWDYGVVSLSWLCTFFPLFSRIERAKLRVELFGGWRKVLHGLNACTACINGRCRPHLFDSCELCLKLLFLDI